MKRSCQAKLPPDPYHDPVLYLRFPYSARALLFDLGELGHLNPRQLLRVTHAFVSHTHMDHFIGLDRLLRLHLARSVVLTLYGPAGFLERLQGRLAGYTWNLTGSYPLVVEGMEVGEDAIRRATFAATRGFVREEGSPLPLSDLLLEEQSFRVQCAVLDHGIPCLGFRYTETHRVNILTSVLHERGLEGGRWLTRLKEAVLSRSGPEATVTTSGKGASREMTLGELEGSYRVTPGEVVAYVVDVADTEENAEAILRLARGADTLYLEGAFLSRDLEAARGKHHITARRAGELAAAAGARKLRIFHFSPRYMGREEELLREAREGADFSLEVEGGWSAWQR